MWVRMRIAVRGFWRAHTDDAAMTTAAVKALIFISPPAR
jgi:hypothetical protein